MYGLLIDLGSHGQVKASSDWLPPVYNTYAEALVALAKHRETNTREACVYRETTDSDGIKVRDPNASPDWK